MIVYLKFILFHKIFNLPIHLLAVFCKYWHFIWETYNFTVIFTKFILFFSQCLLANNNLK
jgi:hypothetical protein